MSDKKVLLILGISIPIILIVGSMVYTIRYLLTPRQDVITVQTLDSTLIATIVAQTIEVEITKLAAMVTSTETNIPEQTITNAPTATHTPILSPDTAISTNTTIPPMLVVPTFTPVPLICNRAQFVRDVSVQDNTPFAPGSLFLKTWRLKNVGNCTWTTDYKLVFISGNAMDAKISTGIPITVEPNQTVDVSITFKAPNKVGVYRGDWMLSTPSGERFGIGSNGNQTFWVQIRVVNLGNPNLVYDFAANYCQAEWTSGGGKLPCPGTSSASEGFVVLLDTPKLENRQEDELTLWTHPNTSSRGWISGIYPEFIIQPNHHFIAWMGCLADSKGCNINFRLDFKNLKIGVIRNLGSWQEVYDGDVSKIDLDLSPHAGKHVRFILTVMVNGGDPMRANAFWLVPGIIKATSSSITSTIPPPTETPQPTETPIPSETPIPTQSLTEIDISVDYFFI